MPLQLEDENRHMLVALPVGALLRGEIGGGEVVVTCPQPPGGGHSNGYVVSSSSPLLVDLHEGKPRIYRGRISIGIREGALALTNHVSLEDYLRGVLPAEIPASFAPEALRAQAIAARTYALATAGKHQAMGYELCDGPHCQVYLGAGEEKVSTDAAIQDTAGLVITSGNALIPAVYHDCCGGRTAGNEIAWQGSAPLPYLRPVTDGNGQEAFCARSPRFAWTRELSQEKLAAALAQLKILPPISAIEVGSCDENGRPREFTIRGSQGEVTIGAGVLRDMFNRALGATTLPSADFLAAPDGEALILSGRGNGHGVGLCQWGANGMAKEGYTAAQILAHYYTGATVETISAEVASGVRQRRSR